MNYSVWLLERPDNFGFTRQPFGQNGARLPEGHIFQCWSCACFWQMKQAYSDESFAIR